MNLTEAVITNDVIHKLEFIYIRKSVRQQFNQFHSLLTVTTSLCKSNMCTWAWYQYVSEIGTDTMEREDCSSLNKWDYNFLYFTNTKSWANCRYLALVLLCAYVSNWESIITSHHQAYPHAYFCNQWETWVKILSFLIIITTFKSGFCFKI